MENNHIETSIIGTIDLSLSQDEYNSLQERYIGKFIAGKGLRELDVKVYDNEGLIPHFHLENKDKSFDCCICIYEPLYFNHGKHVDILNSAQLKKLNKWLSEPYRVDKSQSNWKMIHFSWITGENNNINIPDDPKQPYYVNMTNIRSK